MRKLALGCVLVAALFGAAPAPPGYSQGETVEELMTNLREAAAGCLEVLAEEGRSPDPEVEVADLAL